MNTLLRAISEIRSAGADILKELDMPLPNFIRLLCVDDSDHDIELFRRTMSRPEKVVYEVEGCNNYEQALDRIGASRHDVYLVDYKLDGHHTALELIDDCHARWGACGPFILWSGHVDEFMTDQMLNSRVRNFISKQETNHAILSTNIRFMVKNWRIFQRVHKFQAVLDRLTGSDAAS